MVKIGDLFKKLEEAAAAAGVKAEQAGGAGIHAVEVTAEKAAEIARKFAEAVVNEAKKV